MAERLVILDREPLQLQNGTPVEGNAMPGSHVATQDARDAPLLDQRLAPRKTGEGPVDWGTPTATSEAGAGRQLLNNGRLFGLISNQCRFFGNINHIDQRTVVDALDDFIHHR